MVGDSRRVWRTAILRPDLAAISRIIRTQKGQSITWTFKLKIINDLKNEFETEDDFRKTCGANLQQGDEAKTGSCRQESAQNE